MNTDQKQSPTPFHWWGVCLLCVMFFIGTYNVYGQQAAKTVSGVVKDDTGEPIPGAVVSIKGSTQGTMTDIDGLYKIEVNQDKATLVYSFIGYQPKEIVFDGKTKVIDVVLSESEQHLEEVVVIGYGAVKKKDLTGSVSHIGREVMDTKVATNAVDFLKGNIAGVNVSIDNGASGGGSIQVRGPASLKAGTSPLIVLDGTIFYGNISDVNPNDIESIDVLKDASSTAIYGSKGSAGVIIISTKKGKSEKPVINVSARLGVAKVGKLLSATTPEQYLQRRVDYFKTNDYFTPEGSGKKGLGYYDNPDNLPSGVTKEDWAGYDPSFSGDYTETWLTRIQLTNAEILNYKAGRTTDWLDLMFRNAFRQDYSASVSGKSKTTNYYVSVGHTDNEGYKFGDNYKTTRARVNLDTEITKWLKIGVNSQFSDRDNSAIGIDTGQAYVMSPYASAYNEDGSVKLYPTDDARVANPLLANSVDKKFYRTQNLNATIYGLVTLPYGFTFQTNFNNRYGWRKQYYYTSELIPGQPAGGSTERNEYSDYEWVVDNMLKWNYKLKDIHQFDVTLVASSEKYQFWNTIGTNKGFQPNGDLGYHNTSGGEEPKISANDEVQTGNALLGRLNYSLSGKYLLTASIRRDGFSAFGANNAYGTYPAFAAAWRLSEESFIKNKVLDNLKLRFSWGENGNRDIGRYSALSKLNISNNIIDGEDVTGLWTDNLSNKKLKWERTQAANIGIDFSIYNGRLSGIIDIYSNKTTDLILMRALPTITGFNSVISNLGQVNNKGFEITLSSLNLDIPKKMNWTSTFIYSTNQNTIKHLYGNMVDVKDKEGNIIGQREADDIQNGWYIGHDINAVYDYKMIGIWQLGEEEEAKKYGKQPGDPRLLDADGDGVITESDKQFLGTTSPRYRMSLRNDFTFFNCLNLAFVLRGEFNYLGKDNTARNEGNRYFNTSNSVWNKYWTPDNPSNEYARLGSNTSDPTVNIYKKRDYVRLQNMSLGYIVPKKFLQRFAVDNLKLSFNIDNAFVITNWKYYDPEVAGTSPRIFTFGIDVTL